MLPHRRRGKCACQPGQAACGDACCGGGRPDCVAGSCEASICPVGADFCRPSTRVDCAPGCQCLTGLDDRPICASAIFCFPCATDAECEVIPQFGSGSACVDASGCFFGGCPSGCARPCPPPGAPV